MRSSIRSNKSDGYRSGGPEPSQGRAAAGGMLPIDERPKRRYKKRRGKGASLAPEATEEQIGAADEDAAAEINEQLVSEQADSRPKKRAGTTGQPGARKNYVRTNANRTKQDKQQLEYSEAAPTSQND